jgi:hypothetical protein
MFFGRVALIESPRPPMLRLLDGCRRETRMKTPAEGGRQAMLNRTKPGPPIEAIRLLATANQENATHATGALWGPSIY